VCSPNGTSLGHFLLRSLVRSIRDRIGPYPGMSCGDIASPDSRSGDPWPHSSTTARSVDRSIRFCAEKNGFVDGSTWPFFERPHLSRNFFFRPVIRIPLINALK
jgi:hypothetical protein